MPFSTIGSYFGETFREWQEDDAMQWSAALAYYTALALAPLLVLVLGLTTVVADEQAVRDQILARIGTWVGEHGTDIARTILESDRASGVWASVTGSLFLIFGATGMFAQLQKALNAMWEVEPVKGGWKRLLTSRLLAFALVLGIGAALLASVVARTAISAVPAPGFAAEALNIGLSLAVFTCVLAAIYKVLPDVVIEWRDVAVGALVTAGLFVVGQLAIGLYLGHSAVGSAYGAAGSLVALLVWIYYSAIVLFFGAEFTQVWARRAGRRLQPQEGARRVRVVEVEGEEGDAARPSGPEDPDGPEEGAAYP